MITIDEIRSVAAKVSLANTVVEKDYVLGWLLAGIHQHSSTREGWVFKGGTCLKKCYFETYRFSEDLDFSFRGSSPPNEEQLVSVFSEITDWVYEQAGIEFPKEAIKFEVFKNPRDTYSIQGGVKYRGPVRPNVGVGLMPRIKIDLTLDEPLVMPPKIKQAEHIYSDRPESGISILCYDYEEVFAEKVRALAQRLKPRDLYDVIHLYRRMDLEPDRAKVFSTLESKCRLRSIPMPTIEAIETHDNRALLESEWETQLKHQLPVLPEFQSFLTELPAVLDWLKGAEIEELEPLQVSDVGESEVGVVTQPVATLVLPGPEASYLDRICFAAANRLVVRLGYPGREAYREIEPYSLARSSDGNLLLRAIRTESRESRTYRWDRIQGVEVTSKSFAPEYVVEITSAGYLPIHQLSRQASPSGGGRIRSASSGPAYVYRCSVCKKTFRRKSMDSSLKPHKNSRGRPCYGSYGIYVKTDWSR